MKLSLKAVVQIVEAFFELEHTLETTLAAVRQPNASAQVRVPHNGW